MIQLNFKNFLDRMWKINWQDSLPGDSSQSHGPEPTFHGMKVEMRVGLTHSCTEGNASQLACPEDLERANRLLPLKFLEAEENLGFP